MQTSEHVSETAAQVATKKRSNPRREAQKLTAGMIKDRKGVARNPVIAPTGKKAAKPAAKTAAVPVVLRRIVRPQSLCGRWILIKNPRVFGSTDNWLGGAESHFASREDAIAAARSSAVGSPRSRSSIGAESNGARPFPCPSDSGGRKPRCS